VVVDAAEVTDEGAGRLRDLDCDGGGTAAGGREANLHALRGAILEPNVVAGAFVTEGVT